MEDNDCLNSAVFLVFLINYKIVQN